MGINYAGYTDEELRVIALPHAVALVNQEIFRILNRCNTKEVAAIVEEFVNIMKYGTVTVPEVPATAQPEQATPVVTNPTTFG